MNMHSSPIPLRPDRDAVREAAMTSLARAAINAARSVHDRFAKSAWPDDLTAKLITRGAVTQMTIADSQAFQTVAVAFIASLTPVSAAAQVIARSLQLNFDNAVQINVPSLTLPRAEWVGEGGAIPVVEGTASLSTPISPAKLAAITTMTNEMIRNTGNAETMMRQALLESAGPALDLTMLAADAAVPGLKPAGLLNGIAPLPPSAATSPYDAMVADIAAIATALAPASGASPPILIAAPAQFIALSMSARNPWSLMQSAALPAGTVIGIIPAAVASVVEPPRIEASATTVQMDDQPSADLLTVGRTISLYQSDAIGLRLIWPATWSLRSPSGVAWIEATNW